MRTALIAAVGLLLLSVATLPAAASGEGTAETAVRVHADVAVGDAVLATTGVGGSADAARRDRLLALPGAEPIGVPLLVALGGLLALLVGGGILLSRRGRKTASERPRSGSNGGRDVETEVPATTKPTRNREGGSPAIRTDEEYVVQLLIANHGRMKQARIVEETDWSKAKVSRLLSRMEDQEQIVRERAGREKIVQLADANTSVPL